MYMNMVIHDLRNPILSQQASIIIIRQTLQKIEKYNEVQNDVIGINS